MRITAYRRGRHRLNKDRSNAELMEFNGAKVLLDSVTAQVVKFQKNYHDMYWSLKELKKASRAACKNSDDIFVSLEYGAGEDDLHDLETTANRLTSTVRMMENEEREEREVKEKREVTKSTFAAVKMEKK